MDVFDALNSQANKVQAYGNYTPSVKVPDVNINGRTYGVDEFSSYGKDIDPFLDQGLSYEAIAKQLGWKGTDFIKDWADYTRPGYGIDDGSGGSGGSGGGPVYTGGGGSDDAEAIANETAYWGDQIKALQRLIGSTKTSKEQGLTRIGDTYQSNVGKTEQKRDQGLAQYGTQRTDTTQDRQDTYGNIDTNARTAYDSLKRLFQLGNSGVSSAARLVAPQAVARNATAQRQRATDVFGRNLRDIDTAQTTFEGSVEEALADLLNQKKSTTEDFLRGILSQEAGLNQEIDNAIIQKTIAGGGTYQSARNARQPFQNRISNIQDRLDTLFNDYRAPRFTPKDVTADIPDLAQYLVDPIKVAASRSNPNVDPSLLPYLPRIREREEQTLV